MGDGLPRRAREPGTPGGARLRQLREAAGRTQLWVEAEAELGTGYLQRVESGKVALPERVTLERILTALEAGYGERHEVLGLFGYQVPASPPTAAEIAWAGAACERELHGVVFPAYVLDCAHRLLVWNRFVPPLFGLAPDDPRLGGLAGRSLPSAWFDPASPLPALVVEPDAFLPALIRAFRYEQQRFGDEPWQAALLTELLSLPRFRHYWARVEREAAPASAARALVPVRLAVPGAGVLQFHLSSEPFVRDGRFRMIYYFPANPATIRWCRALSARTGPGAGRAAIIPESRAP
jgi:transcriptional regulator with XRE-family HTH domain